MFGGISQALDKVWHEVIIFKLKQNGISGNLLDFLAELLKDGKQSVVSNGQVSKKEDVTAVVLQGYILDPLLILIYINDLAVGLSSNTKLIAELHILVLCYTWRKYISKQTE